MNTRKSQKAHLRRLEFVAEDFFIISQVLYGISQARLSSDLTGSVHVPDMRDDELPALHAIGNLLHQHGVFASGFKIINDRIFFRVEEKPCAPDFTNLIGGAGA